MLKFQQMSIHNKPCAQFLRQLEAHFMNDLPFEVVGLTETEYMLSDFDIRLRAPWLSGRHGAGTVMAGRYPYRPVITAKTERPQSFTVDFRRPHT